MFNFGKSLCIITLDIGEALTDINKKLDRQERVTSFVAKEVVIQHRMRMDKWTSSKRTKKESIAFKNSLIEFYQCKHQTDNSLIKCMILDQFFARDSVIAGHIWKHETAGEGLEEFGLQCKDLHNPRNGILMCSGFEKAFDVKQVCLLVDRIRSDNLVVKVLDPELLDVKDPTFVSPSTTVTFAAINGRSLAHPTDKVPFRRILDFHAKCSFRVAAAKGWIDSSDQVADFFDMSIGASVPDLNVYQELFGKSEEEEEEQGSM